MGMEEADRDLLAKAATALADDMARYLGFTGIAQHGAMTAVSSAVRAYPTTLSAVLQGQRGTYQTLLAWKREWNKRHPQHTYSLTAVGLDDKGCAL